MNVAVLFDGAGLARLGLEAAGHVCTGFEIALEKHHLSLSVGSGNSILADVRDVDLSGFDAVWASPPCQERSDSKPQKDLERKKDFDSLLDWSLAIPERWPNITTLWVENVIDNRSGNNDWGTYYNAAQFLQTPIQNRNRIIGGIYKKPFVWRAYKRSYLPEWNICPAIMANEYGGGVNLFRKASSWYGRTLTLQECAYHQGFTIPDTWHNLPSFNNPKTDKPYTKSQWKHNCYHAIGNGVPTYMAFAFGAMYSDKEGLDWNGATFPRQLELF